MKSSLCQVIVASGTFPFAPKFEDRNDVHGRQRQNLQNDAPWNHLDAFHRHHGKGLQRPVGNPHQPFPP